MNIADIHCHIMPYVDDGAVTFDEFKRLLESEVAQGAAVICCTPHLRRGMFETPDDEIRRQFQRMKDYADQQYAGHVSLFLSREYHYDALFQQKLADGTVIPLGRSKTVLTEFSSAHSEDFIVSGVRNVINHGFRPLIAHAERYTNLRNSKTAVERLIDAGALIQMNAGSILGREGFERSHYCRKQLKKGLVHVVASDAHDTETRPVELESAYKLITKKCGQEAAEKLLQINPLSILQNT
ncbi:MAG: hypothetical protein IJL43_06135 [Lachnospiraceae bacterium]|nr:hypothetical protein [Lachnospiraceae bacterium]